MALEIERKFLVNKELWNNLQHSQYTHITQGFLVSTREKSIRIRIKGDQGFITIKGEMKGISRPEFEYEIPLKDARELLQNYCNGIIEKTRYELSFMNKTWEVDVFDGENLGLIIAEIELMDENEIFDKPEWIGEEVTTDARYLNENLAKNPYKNLK
ncbi:MAG: CYTH domain-containing protein [Flavobacteriaceae bacterium]|nr:CYTH domain-containing protein [Flavobacteriaceae bacterium]